VIDLLPETNTFVDVFGGSGVVLFNKKRVPNEVYNDINSGVVSLYRVLRDDAKHKRLVAWLEETVHAYEEWVHCKETWRNVEDDVERAGRWLYMINYSFAGQGRAYGFVVNGKNSHSVHLSSIFPALASVKARLRGVNVENADWRIILEKYDSYETTFYLDPPYPESDMRACYGKNIMEWEEHREMMRVIEHLKGNVVLSGYANPVYDAETFWLDRHETQAFVSTGGKHADRRKATEVVWRKM
jgi:DNA adenine methylase